MRDPVPTAAAVARQLTLAFPDVFEQAGLGPLTIPAANRALPIADLAASGRPHVQDDAWWTVARHLCTVLTGRGLAWSVCSGHAQAAHHATVDRPDGGRRRRQVAQGEADPAGMALAIAACRAVLGPLVFTPYRSTP